MTLSALVRTVSLVAVLSAAACSENQPTPTATAPAQPAQPSGGGATPAAMPSQPGTPPAKPASTTPPAMPPAAMMPGAMMPAAMPPAAMMPAAMPPMTPPAMMPAAPAMTTGGAGGTTMPAMGMDPAAKQYSYEEVLTLKRDELIAAWSAAPAQMVWVGCSGKYTELKHAMDGTPMHMVPATWGGKCIPMNNKILYNIVDGKPSMEGAGNTASGPAEVKESSLDMKPAVVVVYPGGYELHFRNMGDKLWVGRQLMNGKASGVWYPLGEITGDGMRKSP